MNNLPLGLSILCVLCSAVSYAGTFNDIRREESDVPAVWSDSSCWSKGAPATDADIARIERDCRIVSDTRAVARLVKIAGFGGQARLTVEKGAQLNSASTIEVVYTRSPGFLDVFGEVSVKGSLVVGAKDAKNLATVTLYPDAAVDVREVCVGGTANAVGCNVEQLGGCLKISGELRIGDLDDSAASGTYVMKGGALRAARLNMGGNGTSAAVFRLEGCGADAELSSQSYLSGEARLEFVLSEKGISPLRMQKGYLLASSASIVVSAEEMLTIPASGIQLIDVSPGASLPEFTNLALPEGCQLDYRTDDGVYLIQHNAE